MKTRFTALLAFCVLFVATATRAQQAPAPPPNPFAPPKAQAHYAPDRDYDLLHVALDLNLDYPKLAFQGIVAHKLSPLRGGLATITFDCGARLNIESCEIDGQKAPFSRDGEKLRIAAEHALAPGQVVTVTIHYRSGERHDGFHWIKPTSTEPQRVGFWTGGQPDHNHGWIPVWDYPNDFATSETRVTVPADWFVVGNGALKSNTLSSDGATRTFHWQMEQPHATYLLSLAGGPLDIKTDDWRGVTLLYVVPKGKANAIEETFGETPEMLSFYSDILGVKYPWPKYAQSAMYDFGGGLENVSATLFGEGLLADKRRGVRTASPVVAHELAHQWFGDLVTYKHWGELWLGEGFAIFFGQILYAEHWRGKNEYDHSVENFMQGYFNESRRYQHPISTTVYENFGAMFDSHSYAKGGVLLHTLRRKLGDKTFFQGIHHYLAKYRNTPVDSHDLCEAMTEATGINLEPFFNQWIFKPGHPVLDYTWTWDEAKKQVVLTVKQTQDTKDGTPVYDLDATVGLISGEHATREKARINKVEQQIRIGAASKPDVVLLDPDHDFLRQIPALHWTPEELPQLLKYAPNAVDRQEALKRMLDGTPSDAAVQAVVEALRADTQQFPVFRSIERLGELKRPDLRPLFREQMAHPAFGRRAQAIRALAQLPKDESDIRMLRGLINDQEPYAAVRASLQTLRDWDAAGNRDIFDRVAQAKPSGDPLIRLIAFDALVKADTAEGKSNVDPDPQMTQMLKDALADIANGVKDSSRMTPEFRDLAISRGSVDVARWLKELKSFTFLLREDVADRGMERRGAKVNRLCYYIMVTGQNTLYLTFYLTTDNKVTDLDISRE
ncbi:MAG TPA: M1 family aminopeptidase [Acidobacteriota bacterium]